MSVTKNPQISPTYIRISNLQVLAEEAWLLHDPHFFCNVVLSNQRELLRVGRTQRIVRVLDIREKYLVVKWIGERCC